MNGDKHVSAQPWEKGLGFRNGLAGVGLVAGAFAFLWLVIEYGYFAWLPGISILLIFTVTLGFGISLLRAGSGKPDRMIMARGVAIGAWISIGLVLAGALVLLWVIWALFSG